MNEETIIEKRPTMNGQTERKDEGHAWKHVSLGGVSGILMGAGLMYAGQAVASTKNDESAVDAPVNETAVAEQQETGRSKTAREREKHFWKSATFETPPFACSQSIA